MPGWLLSKPSVQSCTEMVWNESRWQHHTTSWKDLFEAFGDHSVNFEHDVRARLTLTICSLQDLTHSDYGAVWAWKIQKPWQKRAGCRRSRIFFEPFGNRERQAWGDERSFVAFCRASFAATECAPRTGKHVVRNKGVLVVVVVFRHGAYLKDIEEPVD